MASNRSMSRLLYVLGGPLIWVASLAVLALVGARGCAGTGAVIGVLLLAVAGCAWLMYVALRRVRGTAPTASGRMWHFAAGGTAALAMAAIGATAFLASLSTRC